ncbi:hypothetical protein PVAG01_09204 [Phlyctema vagabunda]|uniref:Nucleoporin Nup159/Nup146 N-terminal domain-containing protein n=1 Tax=Phlyctema vagabunda TaxID=108571 RepID=A0ABR4P6P4_9HELO
MSVASQKGLIAAAGPDVVVVGTTQSVRKAFEGPSNGDSDFRPYQPQLTIPMPMKISQLAFSSDETYLILSAAEGGGLAVYEVQTLLQGSTESVFQMSTEGQTLRALIPNPKAERGELIAVVTNDGNLMIANLKERSFVSGSHGQVLKDGVSCISWSAQGKQLVAGLGNGTVVQMKPDGTGTGEIPASPTLDGVHHVSSISWLENHVFLIVYTPSNFESDAAPASIFNVVTRQPPSSFTFQKIADPSPPFGLNRSPPHHFFLRLRDFPPNLQDLVVVASTASTDIGLLSRSKVPLSGDKQADIITGNFTMTEMSDDSRRAQMPMTSELGDTSPIGMALDLSSTDKVVRPIPRDEIDESPSPLPALMVLNNDGVLASWWIVYSDSIRQGTTYPGLVVADGAGQSIGPVAAPASANQTAFGAPPAQPAFGQSAFGNNTDSPGVNTPAFGTASKATAFGAPGGLGKSQSPWGAPSSSTPSNSALAFGNAAFGSSTQPQKGSTAFGSTAFGAPAGTSTATSGPSFGTPAFGQTSAPAFGSSGLPGNRSSPWSSAATSSAPSSGGFASFAQQGGFATAAPPSTGSIFGSTSKTSNQHTAASTVFGGPASNSVFGASDAQPTTSLFGGASNQVANKQGPSLGSGGFVLGSTFKPDNTVQDTEIGRKDNNEQSLFGGNFGTALGNLAKSPPPPPAAVSQETDMDDDANTTESKEEIQIRAVPTTPTPTTAPAKFTSVTPVSDSLFGAASTTPSTVNPFTKPASPATQNPSESIGNEPISKGVLSTGPIVVGQDTVNTNVPATSTPAIKKEILQEDVPGVGKDIPAAPLSQESTITANGQAGDIFKSIDGTDAPLPPDFMPKVVPKISETTTTPVDQPSNAAVPSELVPPIIVPDGPEDAEDDSDFLTEDENSKSPLEEEDDSEGSGEDVTKDLSPLSETNPTTGFTPQSKFGGSLAQDSASNSLFNTSQKLNLPNPSRSLFGEIDRTAPVLPPPKLVSSPRSPSPMRSAIGRLQRPDTLRSVSAPGAASQLLGPQRAASKLSGPSQTLYFAKEQQKVEEQRLAALQAKREAEKQQALVDEEDEMVQKFLASEVTGTRILDEFVAHSDYIGDATAESIPAQIETVYRDINSMIDTLGINARALKSFIKGHTEQYKDEGRTRVDFEEDQDWVLVETEDLGVVLEKDLAPDLESGRVKNVTEKLESCSDLSRDISRLRAKHEDVAKILFSHTDENQMAIIRSQPLSAEQAAQQHDLRKSFMQFQELLAEAEEDLTILKAGLASQTGSGNKATPTVEAVMRTITKMTSMAEKRSGDIDLLENQMRKFRFGSGTSVNSREGSPFATPQKKNTFRNPGTASTYGLFYTPDSNIRENSRGFQNSLMSSTGSFTRSSPPRKKLSGFSAGDKALLRIKLGRRKEVVDKLKVALQRVGTSVRTMDDDDDSA